GTRGQLLAGDAPAVERYGCADGGGLAGREGADTATHAKTGDADPTGANTAVRFERGTRRAHVGDDLRVGPPRHETDRLLQLAVPYRLAALPVVKFRRHRAAAL